ncbi:MAG TPA: hypothetical protein VI893_10875 [Thermoplasmata archaeon]|nr:hypothetical protein [Thermoplasmata archaeon]
MATYGKTSWKYVGTTALTGGELLKFSAKGEVDLASANTDKFVGTAAEACGAGNVTKQNIGVWPLCPGTTLQVIASAAITAGDYLTATTGGKVVSTTPKATYEASAVEWILGYANEAAAADLDVIEMVCFPTSQSQ